ncbi:hypothetical protein ACFO3U_08715 [Flavobacterium ponti]|uniref:Uncharacterized protein n=1 Tax=Flavobacterium ponti TaxID=665133 RepID=A0ABV9P5T9_9FLAO
MNTKEENYNYIYLKDYLEKENSEKAKLMLDKIKAIKTNDEFITFMWDLKQKLLLDAF